MVVTDECLHWVFISFVIDHHCANGELDISCYFDISEER